MEFRVLVTLVRCEEARVWDKETPLVVDYLQGPAFVLSDEFVGACDMIKKIKETEGLCMNQGWMYIFNSKKQFKGNKTTQNP